MRIEEAKKILITVKYLFPTKITTILNIGSSTRHFREVSQPHISSELLEPLAAAGFKNLTQKPTPAPGGGCRAEWRRG